MELGLGGTSFVVTGAILVAAIETFRDRRVTIAAYVAITFGGQFALSNLIKLIVERSRPDLAPLTGFSGTSFSLRAQDRGGSDVGMCGMTTAFGGRVMEFGEPVNIAEHLSDATSGHVTSCAP